MPFVKNLLIIQIHLNHKKENGKKNYKILVFLWYVKFLKNFFAKYNNYTDNSIKQMCSLINYKIVQ